jgi:ribosomal protein S18 acetylase RimI-like enzyme
MSLWSDLVSLVLRKALQTDGPEVFELIWSARNEIPLKDKFYSNDNKAWITQECKRKRVWIAEAQGAICGALCIQHDQLFYLVVAEEKRRQGIARLLLSKGKKKGRYCRVSPSNRAVISLLESEGFV